MILLRFCFAYTVRLSSIQLVKLSQLIISPYDYSLRNSQAIHTVPSDKHPEGFTCTYERLNSK